MLTHIRRSFLSKAIVVLVVVSMIGTPVAPAFAQETPPAPESSPVESPATTSEPQPASESPQEEFSFELPGESSDEQPTESVGDTLSPEDPLAEEPETGESESLAEETEDSELGDDFEMSLLSGDDEGLESTAYGKSTFSYENLSSRVDNSTGALTQRVPIAIPPGRNGMQPDVALEYNSQHTEDGIVGYGWTVSVPYIERMNKFGSQTLYSGDGNFSSSLHGELATTSSATSSPTLYMARVDTGHATIYSYDSGTDTWTAYDKNGTRYRYGASSQSRQSATSTYKWMLEEIRDTNDNFVRYVYSKDSNQIYPSQILYTGNGGTDGIMEVSFATSSRPDVLTSYKPGFKVTTNYRISRITASVSGTWVRKYDIGYSAGNNGSRSLLSSVTLTGREEGGTELSMPPLTFEYSNSLTQFVAPSHSTMLVKGPSYVVADVNGNSKNDITVFYFHSVLTATSSEWFLDQSTQTGGVTPPDYWAGSNAGGYNLRPYNERGVRFLDVNADGKADVAGPLGLHLNTYSYGGSYGWSLSATSTANIPSFRGSSGSIHYPAGVLGDINGDGLPDFARKEEGGSAETSLGNGAGWDTGTSTIFAAPKGMPVPWQDSGYNSQLVDINADGLDDWMYSENSNTYFLLNNGLGWDGTPDSRWTFATSTLYKDGSHPYFDRGIRLLDINGDGYPDIVRAYKGGPQSTPSRQAENADIKYVYLNTGSGWATSTVYTLPEYIMSAVSGDEMKFNEYANWTGNGQNNQDVLATTTYPTGGKTIAEYTKSAMLGTNPELPISLLVVTKLTTTDVTGRSFNRTYSYSGGKMYLTDGVRDRKFAGFYNITETGPHAVTRTYFNQGDSVSSSDGEQSDGYAQMNRPFREDILDSMGAATLQRTYFRWDTATTGASTHLGLGRKMTWSMGTAGSHKDRATEYLYSTTIRDLIREIDYGEVTGTSNGGFADVLSDIRTTHITYATSSSINLSVPVRKEIVSATTSAPAATSTQMSVLLVGGGGNGGSAVGQSGTIYSGGGGGGGVIEQTLALAPGSYSITVGAGGSSTGNSSIASLLTAIGGGDGGSRNSSAPSISNGGNGGSGGGGVGGAVTSTGGTGTSGQGYHGSNGLVGNGGGGGGCGNAASSTQAGGNGCSSSISGTLATYGGGGGGANGTGGSGGGGAGSSENADAIAGSPNSGGGGGGGYTAPQSCPGSSRCNGAPGGSGIVIIKYLTGAGDATGGTITQSGGYTIHTFTASSTFVLSTSTTPSSSATSSDEIYYYDNLSYGQVDKGNQTRAERSIDATRYASTTKTYNSLGLVTGATDARGKSIGYSYDAANYYPATVTNALSQATTYSYDYATGKITESIDPNGRKTKNVFDAVGRVKRQDQSDVASPSSYVTKSAFTFVDSTTTPSSVLRTDYLNAASTTLLYEYSDGFGRAIQRRASSGYTGTTTVTDIVYDSAEQVGSSTLPYFASGTSYSSPSATTALYTSTAYDALQRPTLIRNAVGSTTITYAGWSATTTDANGNSKAFLYDAFKDLVGVNEVNEADTYQTRYEYDASSNLTKITDALGNVRNFTYDRLGRRLTAEDLHAVADGTYGTWSYTYDDAGNLISQTDPKSQTVNRTYDDLSRVLTEDYTGAAGTEVTYTYDSCTNGIGYLCSASSTAALTAYAYEPLGRVAGATTTIQGTAYGLGYAYDRLGNVTALLYPDGREVRYTHDGAARIYSVDTRPASGSYASVIESLTYAPHSLPEHIIFGNGAETVRTFNSSELYRLSNLLTGTGATTTIATSTLSGPLANDLVGYWKLDETSGNAADSSGNGNTLTNTNSATFTAGKINNGGSFDHASQQSFDIADGSQTGLDVTGNLSICGWVYYPSVLPSDQWMIASKWGGSNGSYFLSTQYNAGAQQIQLNTYNGASNFTRVNWSPATSTWYHICATYNTSGSSNVKFYVNGSQQGSAQTDAHTSIASGSETFSIGSQPSDRSFSSFTGMIDEVGVWSRELSSTDVSNLYNSGSGREHPFGSIATTTTTTYAQTLQDIAYEYDAVGNILSISESASTSANRTVEYTYDDLNRLLHASGSQIAETSATSSVHALVVGGGAAGGVSQFTQGGAGGGGAGGFLEDADVEVALGAYAVTVGAGGAGASDLSQRGAAGGSSSFGAELTALGGGGGASPAGVGSNGTAGNGASGGGGSGNQPNISGGGSGTSGQGSNGGNGYSFSTRAGGGGGGASSVGTAGTNGVAGIGGAGATSTITGTSTVYAKGGNGVVMNCCGGHAGASGAANTGNGGEAGHTVGAGTPAGSGGSGIVVIRYASTSLSATGGTIATDGGDVIHTFTSNGTFTVVSVGGSTYATSSESYEYNAIGNIVAKNTGATTTYAYAGTDHANPHAPTEVDGVSLAYDNNGNLTAYGTTTYAYDYANRMIQAVGNGATSTYAYDHAGSRVLQTVGSMTTAYPNKFYSITSTTIGTTTYATSTSYIFAGDALVSTIDQAYINGSATGTPTTLYIHPDHLGSTNVVTNASGTVVQLLDYYPYGAQRVNTGSNTTDRQYIGERYDAASGLQYLNARYYEGLRGQFLSQDPEFLRVGFGDLQGGAKLNKMLSEPQRLNSYSYAGGNPITNKDPGGEDYYHFDNGKVLQMAPLNRNNNYYQHMDAAQLNLNRSLGESNRGNLALFYVQVNTGGDWDYKNNPEGRQFYFYNGELLPAEVYGNQHYGDVGTAFGIGPRILTDAAGVNQIQKAGQQNKGPTLTNWAGNFDDPRDTANIRIGINNYNNANRPNSSTNFANGTNAAYTGSGTAGLVRSLSALVAALSSLVSSMSSR